MLTPIQILVRAFLSLTDIQKIQIIKNLQIFEERFDDLDPNKRDREIFKIANEKNILKALWEETNKVSPFDNPVNPF
jgi:hypothetical protein